MKNPPDVITPGDQRPDPRGTPTSGGTKAANHPLPQVIATLVSQYGRSRSSQSNFTSTGFLVRMFTTSLPSLTLLTVQVLVVSLTDTTSTSFAGNSSPFALLSFSPFSPRLANSPLLPTTTIVTILFCGGAVVGGGVGDGNGVFAFLARVSFDFNQKRRNR